MTNLEQRRVSFDILIENWRLRKTERQASIKAVAFFINYQRKRCLKKLYKNIKLNSLQRYQNELSVTYSKHSLQKIGLYRWKQCYSSSLRNRHFVQITNIFPTENYLLICQYFSRFFQLLKDKIRKQKAKRLYFHSNSALVSQAFQTLDMNRLLHKRWKKQNKRLNYEHAQSCLNKLFAMWVTKYKKNKLIQSTLTNHCLLIPLVSIQHCFQIWLNKVRANRLVSSNTITTLGSNHFSMSQLKNGVKSWHQYSSHRRMDQSNFNKAKIHHRQRLLKQVIERFHSNTIKCSQQQRLSVSSNNHYHITFIRHALMQWNNRIFTNLHQQYTMIKRSIHFWKVWRQVLLFIYLKQNVLRGQKKRAKLIGDKTTKSNSTSNAVKVDNVLVKNSLIINNNEHVSGQKNSMRALLTKLNLLVQSSGSDTNETFSSVNHVPKNDVNNIQEQFKSNIIDSRMSRSTGSSGGSSSGNNYNYSAATSSALMKPRPLPEAAKSFSGRTCMMNLVTRDSSKDSKDSRDSRQADLRLARDIILFVQEMRAKG